MLSTEWRGDMCLSTELGICAYSPWWGICAYLLGGDGMVYVYLLSGEHVACAPGPGTHPLYQYNKGGNGVLC